MSINAPGRHRAAAIADRDCAISMEVTDNWNIYAGCFTHGTVQCRVSHRALTYALAVLELEGLYLGSECQESMNEINLALAQQYPNGFTKGGEICIRRTTPPCERVLWIDRHKGGETIRVPYGVYAALKYTVKDTRKLFQDKKLRRLLDVMTEAP